MQSSTACAGSISSGGEAVTAFFGVDVRNLLPVFFRDAGGGGAVSTGVILTLGA